MIKKSLAGILGILILLTGCASSRVYFKEPVGAVFYIDPQGFQTEGKAYKLPGTIDLQQTENPATLNNDAGGRPIRMSLPDGTKLKGFLYVYKLKMDQIERLAPVTFSLTDEQVMKMKGGCAAVVTGYSARNKPVYKINLGIDR